MSKDSETKPLISENKGSGGIPPTRIWKRIKVLSDYLIEDVKRGQIQFKVAIFAVFIIIAFIAILLNARSLMTVMFIGITEDEVGDSDFYITAISSASNDAGVGNTPVDRFLSNFIDINDSISKLQTLPEISGTAARLLIPGTVINNEDSSKNTSIYAIMGDSLTENGYGIGRALNLPALTENEAYILASVDNMAELGGKDFTFKLDILRLIRQYNLLNTTDSFGKTDFEYISELVKTFLPSTFYISNKTIADSVKSRFLNLGLPSVISDPVVTQLDSAQYPEVNVSLANLLNPVINAVIDFLGAGKKYRPAQILTKPRGKWPRALGNVIFVERLEYVSFLGKYINTTLAKLSANLTNFLMTGINLPNISVDSGSVPASVFSDPRQFLIEQVGSIINTEISSVFAYPISSGFEALNLTNRAMTLCAVARDKASIYASFTTYKQGLIRLSNTVMKTLGDVSKYQLVAPMYFGYEALAFVAIFIENIIYMILILLGILSTVLLASLMVFSIDQKTYEFGMLRALGLGKMNIILMLVIQGSIFAVSGWAFGVLLSWTISILMQILFYMNIRLDAPVQFDWLAWLISVLFGFCMPIIVNLYSIKSALSDSIKDSLDLYHRTMSALTVVFMKLARMGISDTAFLVSIELAFYGFLFYYVAPLMFFYNRFDLFIYLFNTVLLATIVSMTILANVFQGYIERTLAWVFAPFIWKQRSLLTVVDKNIKAHRNSNRKTSLMLSLCVCFIIFSGSGIHTQINSIVSAVIIFNGADLNIDSTNGNAVLDEPGYRSFLDSPKIKPMISSYSFVSTGLKFYPYVNYIQIMPKSFYPVFNSSITSVDENFTKTFYSEYYTPKGYLNDKTYGTLADGKKDGLSLLFDKSMMPTGNITIDPKKVYTPDSPNATSEVIKLVTVNMAVPTALVEQTSLDVGVPAQLRIYMEQSTGLADVNIVHTADKIPGMQFSQYVLNLLSGADLLVSTESYANLLGVMDYTLRKNRPELVDQFNSWRTSLVNSSTYGIPKNRMMIRLQPGLTTAQRDIIKNGITNKFRSTEFIVDSQHILTTTEQALTYLQLLNVMIAALTCIISFFMLLIALIKKIKDNIWELGVLRAMGLTVRQIYWIYSIETTSVIFSSLALGLGVGILISWIGTYFYFIFFEVDLGLGFPVTEFTVLIVFLVVTTILTSYVGLKKYAGLSISKLLKGLV